MRRTQAAVERDVYEWNLFSLLATKPRSDRPNQTANRQRNNQQIVHNRPCGCRRFFLAWSQLKPEHKKRSKISFDVISIHERAKAFQWSRGGLLAKCLRKWRKFFLGKVNRPTSASWHHPDDPTRPTDCITSRAKVCSTKARCVHIVALLLPHSPMTCRGRNVEDLSSIYRRWFKYGLSFLFWINFSSWKTFYWPRERSFRRGENDENKYVFWDGKLK